MNVVVCCKLAPDAADIEVNRDGSISLERAEWRIGGFDLHAVEAGVRLVEAGGGKVMALCAGPQKINQSKLKKDLLSRGPDELYLVADDALTGADTALTANVLAQAVRKMGQVDLVLFGEGSADLYFQQTGLQVGERLGMPTLNAISKIEAENGKLVLDRSLESEMEVLEVGLPAALSVTTDINQPRLPGMKEILKAGKKPVVEWSLANIGIQAPVQNHVEVVQTQAPHRRQRKNAKIGGTAQEAAQGLVDALVKEGLI